MKTKNKISKAKAWTRGVLPLCLTACLTLFTSCADFFEQDSNMVDRSRQCRPARCGYVKHRR